ncbi:MAG: glycoside hydrolase domain-containing protein, partial [Eubacteriales bacterium]
GYIPADREAESVSKTLEYAYDDWCIAMMAKSLGKQEDYKTYLTHKQNRYKQIAAKAGQSLQEYNEYSESTAQPSVLPQVATQTMASVNSVADQALQSGPIEVLLNGFQQASRSLADSMQSNMDATQSARNLAFSLLELQQNDLYNFTSGIQQ